MEFEERFSIVKRNEIVDKASRCIWTEQGTPGRDYLLNQRGLSEDTIREFRLGYMPRFVDHQLRGRIILPLYDPSGNLIVVGSRAIQTSKFLPVYWHEKYEKQFYLFGIHNAKSSIVRHQFCIIVEGQFDVLQVANHGIKNVVGLCGNKLSEVHVSIIERYCDDMILALDTDENQAGQRGAAKAVAANQYMWGTKNEWSSSVFPFPPTLSSFSFPSRKIMAVGFPDNTDPDEFIRKNGIDKFKKIVKGKLYELRRRDSS